MKHLIILAGVLAVLLIGASVWLEEGEVVTLVTKNELGDRFETRLWIVDLGDVPYLRAESQQASWLDRVRIRPEVELDRAGTRATYRAFPLDDVQMRETVSLAMADKYGDLNRVLTFFRDHTDSVPIHLQSQFPDDPSPDHQVGATP